MTVVSLVLALMPTKCFVMRNDPAKVPSRAHFPPKLSDLIPTHDRDGNTLLEKRVFSSLEESKIIVVNDPPNNVLGVLLFWVGEGEITVTDPRIPYRSYHVECTDAVSRAVQLMFPSMFSNSEYELGSSRS